MISSASGREEFGEYKTDLRGNELVTPAVHSTDRPKMFRDRIYITARVDGSVARIGRKQRSAREGRGPSRDRERQTRNSKRGGKKSHSSAAIAFPYTIRRGVRGTCPEFGGFRRLGAPDENAWARHSKQNGLSARRNTKPKISFKTPKDDCSEEEERKKKSPTSWGR